MIDSIYLSLINCHICLLLILCFLHLNIFLLLFVLKLDLLQSYISCLGLLRFLSAQSTQAYRDIHEDYQDEDKLEESDGLGSFLFLYLLDYIAIVYLFNLLVLSCLEVALLTGGSMSGWLCRHL